MIELYYYTDKVIQAEFGSELSETKEFEATEILKKYDWYTDYIDDGQQYKNANLRNGHLILTLEREFGLTRFELVNYDGTIERKVL